LLELFHPDGFAHRALVRGGNCPEVLRPLLYSEASEVADLVVFAPTAAECGAVGWLEDALRELKQRLAPDGIVYVVAPPLSRLTLARLFNHCDLAIDHAILHLPDPASSRYLIPLAFAPARYAVSNILSLTFYKRLLAVAGLCLIRSSKLFRWLFPSTCLVVHRPGDRPIFEWLFRLNSERDGNVLLTTSSRGNEGAVALHCFSSGAQKPSAIAKITMKPTEAVMGEVAAQGRLGPAAHAAGAQVARVLSLTNVGDRSVLLQTALRGQLLGALLASQPNRLAGVLERLVCWLESWNRSTRTTVAVDAEFFEREILAPARLITAEIDQGKEYQQWLEIACRAQGGTEIPLVTAHNDLTMWNLLLDADEGLGVVDWESACEHVFPFVDFFYATADAVMIARGSKDRSKIFPECFLPGGGHERMIAGLLRRLRPAIGAGDELVELCFHACWLHHAVNERRATRPAEPQPFREIVQWLALNQPEVGSWLRV
jgi:hypothetical protein